MQIKLSEESYNKMQMAKSVFDLLGLYNDANCVAVAPDTISNISAKMFCDLQDVINEIDGQVDKVK